MNNTCEGLAPQTRESQDAITPKRAKELLLEGNERFVTQTACHRDTDEYIEASKNGQWPFAAVLCCIDSRVPAETIFDQAVGDIFTARVAGNFVNIDILGSLEYATAVAGSKLIVVLGHTGCGAVKSACLGVELGNITHLLSNIKPAVERIKREEGVTDPKALPEKEFKAFAEKVALANVELTIENMISQSPIIKELAEDPDRLAIVGAIYDVQSGKITTWEPYVIIG